MSTATITTDLPPGWTWKRTQIKTFGTIYAENPVTMPDGTTMILRIRQYPNQPWEWCLIARNVTFAEGTCESADACSAAGEARCAAWAWLRAAGEGL